MIKLEHVNFEYQKNTPVLSDISFEIGDEECVILLGPNGVGKSTIINCIIGALKIKNGDILFDGINQKELKNKDKAKLISYVPQSIQGTDLTVKETITLGRIPHFMLYPTKEDEEIINQTLRDFELDNIKDKNTNEISGGERQKVAIARALIQDAKTIIFDEPTSNLDIKAQLSILNIIKKITKKDKKASLISMHDINQALVIGDKFIFLKDDKVYRICTKEQIDCELLSEVYDTKIKIITHEGRRIITYEEND